MVVYSVEKIKGDSRECFLFDPKDGVSVFDSTMIKSLSDDVWYIADG
jgi:hypothetical protein